MDINVINRRSKRTNCYHMFIIYSLEGLMLKHQYFSHLIQSVHSLEKTLLLGKIEGNQRRKGQQRMRWLDSITNSTDMNLSKL